MAAKITKALGVEVKLIAQGRGIFDVVVDGTLAYSKYETGVFPDEAMLVARLNSEFAP